MHCSQVYSGLTAAARGIVAQHGVRGLYRGLGITMVEIVPYSALQFGLYDSLNSAYNKFRVRCLTGRRKVRALPLACWRQHGSTPALPGVSKP